MIQHGQTCKEHVIQKGEEHSKKTQEQEKTERLYVNLLRLFEKAQTEQLPALMTVKQLQQLLQLSRGKVYALVNRKDFPSIRFGRSIRIPRDLLFQWLRDQTLQ